MGSVGTRGRLQRPADRQQGLQKALPCRRAHRRLDYQTGRKDRQGGRKGPQTLRGTVRRGAVPRHQSARGGDYRETKRNQHPHGTGAQRQRPRRPAPNHHRHRDSLPHFGNAQLDGGTPVQPDVRYEDRFGGRRSEHHLSETRNGTGHLRQFPQRAEDGPHEDSFRHRTNRQGFPQRNRRTAVHLSHARIRTDGDAVLRTSGRRARMVREVEGGPHAVAPGTRFRRRQLSFP